METEVVTLETKVIVFVTLERDTAWTVGEEIFVRLSMA